MWSRRLKTDWDRSSKIAIILWVAPTMLRQVDLANLTPKGTMAITESTRREQVQRDPPMTWARQILPAATQRNITTKELR